MSETTLDTVGLCEVDVAPLKKEEMDSPNKEAHPPTDGWVGVGGNSFAPVSEPNLIDSYYANQRQRIQYNQN